LQGSSDHASPEGIAGIISLFPLAAALLRMVEEIEAELALRRLAVTPISRHEVS
jgi:hypothetical protein